MMNTLVPTLADHLGAHAFIVRMTSSMFAITALGISPAAGPAMDYFKKNRLLAAANGLVVLAFIGYGCAGNIEMIMAARLIHRSGIAFIAPFCLALWS